MPDIPFYLDMDHYKKYKSLENEQKREINAKLRKTMYKELDKAKANSKKT
jgi:hypothetical protein